MREAGRWCAGLVGALCLLAACSSEAESTAPVVELSTTTVTTLPPTTVTTEAPTTTEDPRIAEVEAAVAAFHSVQVATLMDPSKPLEDLIEVASGELLETASANISMARADGRVFEGEFESNPESTTFFAEDVAVHAACVFDQVAVLAADGSVLVPADETPVVLEYRVVLLDGSWIVTTLDFAGDSEISCDFA